VDKTVSQIPFSSQKKAKHFFLRAYETKTSVNNLNQAGKMRGKQS
jgi:hypothetical protein